MTTHDQNIEATPSPEKVGPATARTEHRTEHAASSAVAAEPSTAQTESTFSAGEPSAVATDAVTNQYPTTGRAFRTLNSSVRIGDRGYRRAGWDDGN